MTTVQGESVENRTAVPDGLSNATSVACGGHSGYAVANGNEIYTWGIQIFGPRMVHDGKLRLEMYMQHGLIV
jgi:hypothetical protein